MKRYLVAVILTLFAVSAAWAQVPGIINYQGRVSVAGTNFDGTGQFKFALVNNTGAATYWSNGVNTVSLTVTKGLYSVLLGDTGIPNMSTSIPAPVFTNSDVRLRAWFNDGISGLQQLTPDQRLAAVGYALMAADVGDGTITSNKLAAGAVGATQLADSAVSSNKLAAGAVGNSALAAASVTGDKIADWTIADADISPSAAINAGKIVGGDLQAARLMVGSGHTLSGAWATIAGGYENTASNDYATVGGGYDNTASRDYATVSGGQGNTASDWAAVVGGGTDNTASRDYATISGGEVNTASGYEATVGGGGNNTASAEGATVSGGGINTASGYKATVGGGYYNQATNSYATVPGGYYNFAGGAYSFAAGRRAKALHNGAFVWGDSNDSDVSSTTSNQFTARAAGGVRFFTNPGATIGSQLTNNAIAWSTMSDRNIKENFQPVNVRAVLEKLAQMPVTEWNVKQADPSIRHIGPMAQDFHAAFHLNGPDDRWICTSDADGVALAAIKGLYEELKDEGGRRRAETDTLRAELKENDKEIGDLRRELAELRDLLSKLNPSP
jgi:microcystin-dependent protein